MSMHETRDGVISPGFVNDARAALDHGWSILHRLVGHDAVHEVERQAVFEANWHAVCSETALAGIGDRFVGQIADVPIVIVRSESGDLNGFVNVCRHRAYPVARDERRSRTLTCRYHGWTYDLAGDLIRAPDARDLATATCRTLSLKPLSVTAWRGCVFAHLDPAAAGLPMQHPELECVAGDAGFDLADYEPHSRFELDIASDWKLVYDNVVECYHCPSMHATTLNTLYEARGFTSAAWHGAVRYATAGLKETNRPHHCLQIFPGTYLVADPVIGIVGRFYPTAAGCTRFDFQFLSAPGADEAETDRFADIWQRTLLEDKDILEAQFAGAACGQLDRTALVRGQEDCLFRVHRLILDAYQASLNETPTAPAAPAPTGDEHATLPR